jgi:hypothetical protein
MKNRTIKSNPLWDNKRKLIESELKYSKQERQAFLESIRQFSGFKQHIYRAKALRQVSEQIGQMIEAAEQFTLKETDQWFDNVTVSRHMKQLKESYKVFSKTCNEIETLQQRLEACYEDIGKHLGTYYDV